MRSGTRGSASGKEDAGGGEEKPPEPPKNATGGGEEARKQAESEARQSIADLGNIGNRAQNITDKASADKAIAEMKAVIERAEKQEAAAQGTVREALRKALEAARKKFEEEEGRVLSECLSHKFAGNLASGRENTFANMPTHIKRKFVDEIPAFKDFRKEREPHPTARRDGTVLIGARPGSYYGSDATLFHESGHAILFKAGQDYRVGGVVEKKFEPILEAARRETAALSERLFGKNWRSDAAGFEYDDVRDAVGIPDNDGVNFCDLLHSATQGKCFYGHGNAYYGKFGASGEIHEIVADATCLLSGKHAEAAKSLMPETFRLVEQIVFGKSP